MVLFDYSSLETFKFIFFSSFFSSHIDSTALFKIPFCVCVVFRIIPYLRRVKRFPCMFCSAGLLHNLGYGGKKKDEKMHNIKVLLVPKKIIVI